MKFSFTVINLSWLDLEMKFICFWILNDHSILSNGHSPANLLNSSTRQKFAIFFDTFARHSPTISPDSIHSLTFDICHFWEKCDSPRHIRTSNSPFWRIWGEWPLLTPYPIWSKCLRFLFEHDTVKEFIFWFIRKRQSNGLLIYFNGQSFKLPDKLFYPLYPFDDCWLKRFNLLIVAFQLCCLCRKFYLMSSGKD